MSQKTNRQVDAMAMRAWRFWVSYLGMGYLHDMFIIPNADTFIKDLSKLQVLRRTADIHLVNLWEEFCRIVNYHKFRS